MILFVWHDSYRTFSKMALTEENKVSGLKILVVALRTKCLRIFNPELQPLVTPADGELNAEL
jgi:hypothetical protein